MVKRWGFNNQGEAPLWNDSLPKKTTLYVFLAILYKPRLSSVSDNYYVTCMSHHKTTPAEQTVWIKNFESGLRKYPPNICLSPDPVLWSWATYVTSLDFSSLIGRARAITRVSETVREVNTGHIPHSSWFTESVQGIVTTVILKGVHRGWTIWKLWTLEIKKKKKVEYHSISPGSSNYCINRTITCSVVGKQGKTCHPFFAGEK